MADRDRHTGASPRQFSRTRLRFAADDRLVGLVRRGDPTAFEILYDRHARELLSFCRYMLGSHADAEDAVQSTFASAHRALLADERPIELRPWLFTIARNASLSILRGRRPVLEEVEASPSREDPVARVEQREDMREMLATLLDLPERQRTALVLSELHGFSQTEIGALLGVRPEQVKSYVFQARSNLISEREARGADCQVIREELSQARGPALLKSRLRRHIGSCPGCREYAAEVAHQRRHLGILLPVAPSLALKRRALEAALGEGGSSAYTGGLAAGGSATAATAELAGGGAKLLVSKLLVGAACLGAGSAAASGVLGVAATPTRSIAPTPSPRLLAQPRLASFDRPVRSAQGNTAPAAPPRGGGPHTSVTPRTRRSPGVSLQDIQAARGSAEGVPVTASAAGSSNPPPVTGKAKGEEPHGNSEKPHGKSEEPHGVTSEGSKGKSEEPHGKSGEPHGKGEEPQGASSEGSHGRSEEPHGSSGEAAKGKSEEPRGGSGESSPVHGEEPHGKAEEPHGKPEEPHGNAGHE